MNTLRKTLLRALGWALHSPKRLRNVAIAAAALTFAVMTLPPLVYATWWNATQLPVLRAEAREAAEHEAWLAAQPVRVLPLPMSMRDVPVKGIPQATVDLSSDQGIPTPTPDTDEREEGRADPTVDLMPRAEEPTAGDLKLVPEAAAAAPTEDDTEARRVADAFTDAYTGGDTKALTAVTTPLAQSKLAVEDGTHPAVLGQDATLVDVVVLGREASATITAGDAMILLTLHQEGEDWLVNDYMVTAPEGD